LTPNGGVDARRTVRAADIYWDDDFAALMPPLAPDERAQLEWGLFVDGCREPLVVWRCQGRLILLIGYEVFPLLRQYQLAFCVIKKEFATRAQAQLFLIKDQLARRHLSPLNVSYLRGLRYHAEKQPRGGDRRSPAAQAAPNAYRKTLEALAEIFCVSRATMRRDAKVAGAILAIAAECGQDVKPLLLAPGSGLTRGRVLALADKPPAEQQAMVAELRRRGRLPRSGRSDGPPATITLPREQQAMVEAMVRRLGTAWFADFCALCVARCRAGADNTVPAV
jgi:hypothetical protein